jgi:hypothetical protein
MRNLRLAIGLTVVVFAMPGLWNTGFAEMPSAAVVAQMKSGKVTGVGKDEIYIDGYTYRIKIDAEIVDHEGQLMPIEEVHRKAVVQYLLKADQIVMMIVTNPQ